MDEEIHTTLRPEGGTMEHSVTKSSLRENIIDPPSPFPARAGLRYRVGGTILGKLERLAQSHWEVSGLGVFTRDQLMRWDKNDPATVWTVVQTVHASSQIEGEGITAEKVPLIFHALTRTNGYQDMERDERGRAYEAVAEAYFWAINNERRPLLSLEFIIELHSKMFKTSKPDVAGVLKRHPVVIKDEREEIFRVRTLPVPKTQEFMVALCERTNGLLYNAHQYATASKLLVIAEFILDFLAIHPFEDGNGRTARLLSTYLLHSAGYFFPLFYPLDSIVLESRNDYYTALFESQRHWYRPEEDLTPWIDYYVTSVFRQWERAFSVLRDRMMNSARPGSNPSAGAMI